MLTSEAVARLVVVNFLNINRTPSDEFTKCNDYLQIFYVLSPVDPLSLQWEDYFGQSEDDPQAKRQKLEVQFADVGCGYGGLLGDICAVH